MRNRTQYPLADIYTGIRMGADISVLKPNELRIVESDRRLRREGGYNYVHALWWQEFMDRRTVMSVPPGTEQSVRDLLSDERVLADLSSRCFGEMDDHTAESDHLRHLKTIIDSALERIGLSVTNRYITDDVFVHNGADLRIHHSGSCRRLTDTHIRGAEGVLLPEQCFPSGIVYGVIADGVVASVAYAHKTGTMEGKVADIGVVTGSEYRGLGFAKTAVSAVTAEITGVGGEALYSCSPDNRASMQTALSVGFKKYGKRFVISAG